MRAPASVGRGLALPGGGGALRLGGARDRLAGGLGLAPRRFRRRRRLAPAREDQPRLGDPDLVGELAVALGGARLPPQRHAAQLHVGEDLVEPDQIGLGRAQFLLGVLAADVEAGDPRRFLEHQPAFGRLGGDHRADLALADQSRAECAPVAASANSKATSFWRTSRPLTR